MEIVSSVYGNLGGSAFYIQQSFADNIGTIREQMKTSLSEPDDCPVTIG
jgi:hypothetical protein